MIRQITIVTLLLLSWGVANAAATAEKGVYIGAGVGNSLLQDDGLFNGLVFDDTDTGIGIFGGYKFFKYLAVEARYTDFGTFSVEGLGIDASVLSIHAVGIIPFGASGWELFGQLGAGSLDISTLGESSSETVVSGGLGVRYGFTEKFLLGIQTDVYLYEEVDFGSTYNVGVGQTAITAMFIF